MHLRAALIAVTALALLGCGGGAKPVTVGAPTTPTPATTSTSAPPPAPATTATAPAQTTTTTATTPAGSPNSPSRLAAERLARSAASQEARKQGVTARPGEWHAECAPAAGEAFDCHVTFNGGQCQGSLHVSGGPTGPVVTNRKVGCGE